MSGDSPSEECVVSRIYCVRGHKADAGCAGNADRGLGTTVDAESAESYRNKFTEIAQKGTMKKGIAAMLAV
jgi:hypothetical protein